MVMMGLGFGDCILEGILGPPLFFFFSLLSESSIVRVSFLLFEALTKYLALLRGILSWGYTKKKLTRLSSCLFLNSTLFHMVFQVYRMGAQVLSCCSGGKQQKETNLFSRGIWNRDLELKLSQEEKGIDATYHMGWYFSTGI